MKKRICTLLSFLAMMFLVGSVSTFAFYYYTFTDDNGIEWSCDKTGDTVNIRPKDKSKISGDITVPATVTKGTETYKVTRIDWDAFKGCDKLTSVEIPKGISETGPGAFSNCSNLISVTIPDGFSKIGMSEFENCSNLSSIKIPDGVTIIGRYAFKNCSSLSSIKIPESVNSIESCAFSNCSNLSSIIIPENVTKIENGAFSNCTNLKSIVIPDTVTHIGTFAFSYCNNLSSVKISDGVTSIENNAFCKCSNLSSIKIPYGVTSIGENAFSNCTNLKSIVIPDTVTHIGNWAFSECSKLSTVTIPRHTSDLGVHAFYHCGNLKTVFYPFTCSIDKTSIPSTTTKIAYETINEKSNPIEIRPWKVTFGNKVTNLTVCPDIVGPYYKLVSRESWMTKGLTVGHEWTDATCTSPKTCSVCGITEGEPLGHSWSTQNGKCERCGVTNPQAPINLRKTVKDVFGQDLELIIEDPNNTLPEGATLMVDWVKPGTARHQELSELRDPTHDAEHITFLEIILRDKNWEPLSMPLTGNVHVLLQLPKDYDKNGTQVSLVRSGADIEFTEEVVTRDGVNYIGFWSDHFSPYSFVDTRSAEEKNALNNTNDSTAINTVSNESTTRETSSAKIAPKTGDSYKKLYIALGSLLVALAALIFMHLKRKKHCIK